MENETSFMGDVINQPTQLEKNWQMVFFTLSLLTSLQ